MHNPFAPELLIETHGAVRVVTLNRPEAMNSANLRLHDALTEVWAHVARDPDARAIVLTGAGRAFSAGGDMRHFLELHGDKVMRQKDIDDAARIVREMTECRLPIVAAVNGPAVGLGCNLAILSDIVLMSDKAYFADPHVSVGLTAADGGAPIWPLFMSILRAKEYLFTGARIPPDVALSLGLANRVVPHDQLMDEAMTLAQTLAAQPTHALQTTKRAINMHISRAIAGVLEYALAEEFRSFDDPEHQAIVHRFTTKSD